MLFLIEYDRDKGEVVSIRRFNTLHKSEADATRLNLELDLNRRGIEHEVVVLEASNEDALRRTHRRYFENLSELVKAS